MTEPERIEGFEYQIRKSEYGEINGQILWFEALLDSLEDNKLDEAIATINGAIKMLKRAKASGTGQCGPHSP